jgi:GT2 family glycosyltransferase
MGSPLVSVIIPCYRQARYLGQAIDSVFAQSYAAVEVIVVSDGSDDDPEAVVRRYGDRVYYIGKPNGGPSSARNAGLTLATGPYVYFLDADDLIHPDAIAWLVEAMAGAEDRVALMGYRRFATDPGRDGGAPEVPDRLDSFFPNLIHSNFGPPHCYLAPRRAVAEAGGWDEAVRTCEDWDLWVRLALGGLCLVTLPRVGAYYRVHAASSSTNRARMFQGRTRLLLHLCRWFEQRPDLLGTCGPELLRAAERSLCRHRARGLATPDSAALARHVLALHRQGLRVPLARPELLNPDRGRRPGLAAFSEVAVDRMTRAAGPVAINAAVAAMRVLAPGLYRTLREDWI